MVIIADLAMHFHASFHLREQNPELTLTYSGFVNDEDVSVLDVTDDVVTDEVVVLSNEVPTENVA